MPELPDVEVYRRRFDAHALHRRVHTVVLRDRPLLAGASAEELDAAVRAHRFTRSLRHGKYLFLGLDGGRWMSAHFGMSGALEYAATNEERVPYERLRLELEHDGRLSYTSRRRLGRIALIDDPQAFVAAKRLGPDALAITPDEFEQRLRGRRGSIKGALMDQSLLAGLGNVYSDEVLFQAGVHPRTPVAVLDGAARARLFRAMRQVLRSAIEADADPARFPPRFLAPHRQVGAACPRCGGTVNRVQLGGRSSYLCERCQPPIA